MVKTERQRQKKLAKRQKRASVVSKQARIHRNPSTRDVILQAIGTPWEIAFKRESQGMASVVAMRRMRQGNPISVCFLIDSYCLGVKDAYISRDIDIDRLREMIREGGDEVTILTPEYIAKWVPEAIAYARSIGIESSKNAELCLLMFSDVDATLCTEEFVFGKDGKPLYVAGPHDGSEKIARVMNALGKLGEGNFNYVLPMAAGSGNALRIDDGVLFEKRLGQEDLDDSDGELDDADEDLDVEVTSTESDTVDSLDVVRIK
jgi:hypothetical protein